MPVVKKQAGRKLPNAGKKFGLLEAVLKKFWFFCFLGVLREDLVKVDEARDGTPAINSTYSTWPHLGH